MQFCYLIRPRRDDFMATMTPAEEAIMAEHFAYLQAALERRQLVLAGPCLNAAFGVVIFEADSPDEATAFAENDPAVRQGVMTFELHPFRVSLYPAAG